MMITTYFSRRKPMKTAFPCLLVLLAVGYIAYHWPNPVELYPDSGGYLNFSEHRTAGYPVFIMLVSGLSGTVDAVPRAQLFIAAWSFAFLGWSFQRAFQSNFFALVPVLLLMIYPQIADVHSYILTESLFIALLCPADRQSGISCAPPHMVLGSRSGLRHWVGNNYPPSGLQRFDNLAIPVLAHLAAILHPTASAGWGGDCAHLALSDSRERSVGTRAMILNRAQPR